MRAAFVLLAACWGPSQPMVARQAPTPALSPPRVVRDGMYGLTVVNAPAFDGARIVAGFRESDGDRGLPNLTLVIKDRDDREVARHVVLSLAEAEAFGDAPDGTNPRLDERVARANRWLREQGTFTALPALAPEQTAHPADRRRAVRGPIVVTWEPNHLRIADGPTMLVNRDTPASWIPENVAVGDNVCLRSPYLGGAAVDVANKLAVVTISSVTDTEFCLPATDQHHVITW